jgi:hypothetical protein
MESPSLNLKDSMSFFHTYMYAPLQGKRRIYEDRGIRLGTAVAASDWEVLASLLVGSKGNGSMSGVDLGDFEVKSALDDGGYEYQYHKETGVEKLKKDATVGHLFFNHSNFLNKIELRYAHGCEAKKDHFDVWAANYPNPYPQRYRNSISFGWVKKNAKLLLVIENSKIVPNPS